MFDGDSDDPSVGKHMDALPTLSHREVASGSGTSEWAVSRLGKEAPTVGKARQIAASTMFLGEAGG